MNTANPNCFLYEAGEILIELLGGVRIDTLDRMHVTMKVTVVNRKHAQHLNNEEPAELSIRHHLWQIPKDQKPKTKDQKPPSNIFTIIVSCTHVESKKP